MVVLYFSSWLIFPPTPVQNVSIAPVLTNLVYYNRIPKTGSENLAFLIKHLSLRNNFTHYRFGKTQPRHLNENEFLEEQRRVCDLPRPALTDRHLHHLGTIQCPVTWISM